jgi:hypothetical protein
MRHSLKGKDTLEPVVGGGSHTVLALRGGDSWGNVSDGGVVVRHCLLGGWGLGKRVPGALMGLDHVGGARVHGMRQH